MHEKVLWILKKTYNETTFLKKKNNLKLLTKEQQESYIMQKSVIFVKKNLKINVFKI